MTGQRKDKPGKPAWTVGNRQTPWMGPTSLTSSSTTPRPDQHHHSPGSFREPPTPAPQLLLAPLQCILQGSPLTPGVRIAIRLCPTPLPPQLHPHGEATAVWPFTSHAKLALAEMMPEHCNEHGTEQIYER